MSIDQGGPQRYALGIDFGTSNTVAVARWPDGRARPILVDGSPLLPSAVFADAKGNLLVGRDAVHSARVDPARFEPNPKRRIDDGLVLLGEREFETVELITAVLARVTEEWHRAVGPYRPQTTLTCPASWGSTRRTLLAEAAARAGLEGARLVAEPVAAATYFAEILGRDVPIGSVVMVHDFGAGTFDASLVARTAEGFEVLAVDGLDDVGGLDIDAAVVEHLRTDDWQPLMEPGTVEQRRARRQLWDDVRIAKERLSRAQSADFVVPLLDVEAHLTREELETVARPVLDRTVEITKNLLRWADLPDGRLAGVFLVGGASRIPLVATLLHRELGDPPVVIEQPEMVVAEGSILAGAALLATEPAAPGPTELLRLPSRLLSAADDSSETVVANPGLTGPGLAGPGVVGPGTTERPAVTMPVQARPSAELAAASAAAADGATVVTGPAEESDTVVTTRPGESDTVVTTPTSESGGVPAASPGEVRAALPGESDPVRTASPGEAATGMAAPPGESAAVTAPPGESATVVTRRPEEAVEEPAEESAEHSGEGRPVGAGEPGSDAGALGTERLNGTPREPVRRAAAGKEAGSNTAAQLRPPVDPWPDAAPSTWRPDPDATAATPSPPKSGWTPVPPRRAGSAPSGKRRPMPVVAHARPISSVPASAPAVGSARPMPARAVAAAPRRQPEPAPRKKRGWGRKFLRGVQILLSVLAMLLIPLAALVVSYGYGNAEPLQEDAVNVFKDLGQLLGLT